MTPCIELQMPLDVAANRYTTDPGLVRYTSLQGLLITLTMKMSFQTVNNKLGIDLLIDLSIDWSIVWLIYWSIYCWLIYWLVYWLIDLLIDWSIDWLIYWFIDLCTFWLSSFWRFASFPRALPPFPVSSGWARDSAPPVRQTSPTAAEDRWSTAEAPYKTTPDVVM